MTTVADTDTVSISTFTSCINKVTNNLLDTITPADHDRYHRDWLDHLPTGIDRERDCWLFAIASVYTSWQVNRTLFLELRKLPDDPTADQIHRCLDHCRTGCWSQHHARISRFFSVWSSPYRRRQLRRRAGDWDLTDYRDRLLRERDSIGLSGLNITKISFAVELLYPRSSEVICLDRHVKRWYLDDRTHGGRLLDLKLTPTLYRTLEASFTRGCASRGYHAPLARAVLWDRLQGQSSSLYWMDVFRLAS